MKYTLVSSDVKTELIVKKSKFITFLCEVKNEQAVKEMLKTNKKLYKDATHICYAYVIEPNLEKCYDDNEPQGTAGLPMLTVLKQNNITNTLAVVIRYFGGVKLGGGGLIRAYSLAVKQAIENAKFIPYERWEEVSFSASYEEVSKLNLLQNENWFEVVKKDFNEQVNVTIKVKEQQKQQLIDVLTNIFQRTIEGKLI